MRPGKQTPGHRFMGAGVVVVDSDAFVLDAGLDGLAVVDVGFGLDGLAESGELVEFRLLWPGISSRRLMQHLPPFAHWALESM